MRLALALGIALVTGFALLPLADASPIAICGSDITTCLKDTCVLGEKDCYGLYCTGHGTPQERCTPYPCQYCVPF